MSEQREFSVARWSVRVLLFGTLLGVALYLAYFVVAVLRA